MKFFYLEIKAPQTAYDQIIDILSDEVVYGWEEATLPDGSTLFRVYCENGEFLNKLEQTLCQACTELHIRHAQYEQQDWLEHWKQFFTPVECGSRFVAIPPWLSDANYDQRVKIIIEPKSAFGTGHHATTALCLRALSDLLDAGKLQPGDTFLDVGSGSGILAIAASLSGLSGVGVDIDELAIENAIENKAINNVKNLDLITGSIDKLQGARFNLIMANILAQPLIDMAPDIVAASQGCLILSGILDTQAPDVEEAYKACGLPAAVTLNDGEWRALIWS